METYCALRAKAGLFSWAVIRFPTRRLAAIAAMLAAMAAASPSQAAWRVAALDQCADQFVLSLSPRQSIVSLSPRADDPDAFLRAEAVGLPLRRASLENLLSLKPDVVVRYWEGDARLLAALKRRGVAVVTLDDASDFNGVRANIRKVAAALGQRARGETLVAELDARLGGAQGAGQGRRVLYLTPSGYTSGAGTLVDAMLTAAGLTNAAGRRYYSAVSLEQMVLSPPGGVVRGFFDNLGAKDRWAMGGHAVVAKLPTLASLPGALLSCPGPSAGVGVERLAQALRAAG